MRSHRSHIKMIKCPAIKRKLLREPETLTVEGNKGWGKVQRGPESHNISPNLPSQSVTLC